MLLQQVHCTQQAFSQLVESSGQSHTDRHQEYFPRCLMSFVKRSGNRTITRFYFTQRTRMWYLEQKTVACGDKAVKGLETNNWKSGIISVHNRHNTEGLRCMLRSCECHRVLGKKDDLLDTYRGGSHVAREVGLGTLRGHRDLPRCGRRDCVVCWGGDNSRKS